MIRRAILPGMEAEGEIQKLKSGFLIVIPNHLIINIVLSLPAKSNDDYNG